MIKFGTDGWRGLIARDFTFENLSIVALATARYINKNLNDKRPVVVIGYDTRFLSRQFAEEVAMIMAWQGIIVHLTRDISSTPQISFHTKSKSATLGVVITASHNPAVYSGYKIKGNFGGPATPEQIDEIETYVQRIEKRVPQFKHKSLEHYIEEKQVRIFDAKESYVRGLKKKIDFNAIKKANHRVLYDPMHGAGIDFMKNLIDNFDEIHSDYNPSFGEIDHPEPIAECLYELIDRMKQGGYDIAFATDGDADRIGAVDNLGNFVDSHKIFMIFLKYLYENKGRKGKVVKTVSLTSMVDAYCEVNEIELVQTPVGFKHIAKEMINGKVLIGGEESGGIGMSLHIPERDGHFNAMFLLEIMAVRNMSLKELCDELDEEFGQHRYHRRDIRVTEKEKKEIISACKKRPSEIGRFKVESMDTTDGYKFFFEGGGWLLIRASGTEPLFRFYAEFDSMSKVNELLDEGIALR